MDLFLRLTVLGFFRVASPGQNIDTLYCGLIEFENLHVKILKEIYRNRESTQQNALQKRNIDETD